ncbi:MAG: MFS transporter, partial [Firmicutes bacterium]|nr:MFS transporter [Bacillota bacterium]
AVFILVERRQRQPMLDLSIFKNTLFTVSTICAFLVFVSLSSINILQPFYLQDARGLNSLTAGLVMMIYPVVLAVAAPLSGYLSDRIGQKSPTLIGLCLSTIGYVGAALMTVRTSLLLTGFVYGFLGVGNALFQSPNTSLIMSTVPKDKLGVAGSVNALARNMGFIFGVLLATSVLFASMSALYGQRVNDYVQGRPDLFIYGMRATYLVIAGVCFVGVLITAFRLFSRGKPKNERP